MGIFDDIYANNQWGFGSGNGSLPSVTKGYRSLIEQFIVDNDIKSVLDYGCGDWQFSKLIDWHDASYLGVDLVGEVVDRDAETFAKAGRVSFEKITPRQTNLPAADLLIIKDVLQHQSTDDVNHFLKHVLPKYRFALITNCIEPTEDLNVEIDTGEFRPLDLRKAPFHLDAAQIYSFNGPRKYVRRERRFLPAWHKNTLLVVRPTR